MSILELTILTSLLIMGFRRATEHGLILEKIGDILDKDYKNKIITFILKPIYTCIYCMSSIYSIVMYSIFMEYSLTSIYELPIIILAVCGLNGIIYNLNYLEWKLK